MSIFFRDLEAVSTDPACGGRLWRSARSAPPAGRRLRWRPLLGINVMACLLSRSGLVSQHKNTQLISQKAFCINAKIICKHPRNAFIQLFQSNSLCMSTHNLLQLLAMHFSVFNVMANTNDIRMGTFFYNA